MKIKKEWMQLPTPCYVVEEELLIKNLEILKSVEEEAGCHILLAQKAFSMYHFYPLIGSYISGATASGLYEAKLGAEEMGKENHVFSPAYKEEDFDEILALCDHIIFNSFAQWKKFKEKALAAGRECGIRINPECSTQDHGIYDPCSKGSRLGVTLANFQPEQLDGIAGLHFHTLCEQGVDALEITLNAVEEKFGKWLPMMKWINFGGGHHITKPDYDVDKLIKIIKEFKAKYQVEVYLEPGEAVALDTGFLVAEVLELIENDGQIAILDTSAACHMPDVLEMPYRPFVIGSGEAGEKKYTYTFGGPTCLAGDMIGTYSFDEPLKIGDKVVFCDMSIYSMVKNNTFNGMPLPAIAAVDRDRNVSIVREFGYEDFKGRL
ncbi:MAG: carboxynorspermidine decarboxylase [Lachnospiraceae bacterium]|nr:carboxynorspermidine decarboxylase [Lachnospiraceae bacterium]